MLKSTSSWLGALSGAEREAAGGGLLDALMDKFRRLGQQDIGELLAPRRHGGFIGDAFRGLGDLFKDIKVPQPEPIFRITQAQEGRFLTGAAAAAREGVFPGVTPGDKAIVDELKEHARPLQENNRIFATVAQWPTNIRFADLGPPIPEMRTLDMTRPAQGGPARPVAPV